jgi:hypothetical protein
MKFDPRHIFIPVDGCRKSIMNEGAMLTNEYDFSRECVWRKFSFEDIYQRN